MNDIRIVLAQSSSQLEEIFDVRREVFVKEQSVDESEEYDEFETSSTHLLAILNDKTVGTCRFRNTDKGIKLERFAVIKSARGIGVGEKLMFAALSKVDQSQTIYLHAQVQVVDFYKKYGFVKVGPEFLEANIRHFKMVYKPTSL